MVNSVTIDEYGHTWNMKTSLARPHSLWPDERNVVQMTDQGVLVAIERHWLTESQRQAKQLERAMFAAAVPNENGGAVLTLPDWVKFRSRLIIDQAVDEVLRGVR